MVYAPPADIEYVGPREDYISWDEYFAGIARLTAMRSKDPSTQVGSVLVSKDNRILSVGYNGTPARVHDEEMNWNRECDWLHSKYPVVVHSEHNAIANYRGSQRDLAGSRLYVDLFPCSSCAKLVVTAGVEEVIYRSDKYAGTEDNLAARRIFDMCGVTCRQLDIPEDGHRRIVLDLLAEG